MKKETSNYDIRTLQLRLLDMLTAFHQVCQDHQLRYYITCGTLLGAVRHQGFIPWDDDLDVAMPREDYDLLLAHAREWLPEPFGIVNYMDAADYSKYFAKMEDESTTVMERTYLPYVGGIYIDLFPLDDAHPKAWRHRWHMMKFKTLYHRMVYYCYRDPYKHGRGPNSWIPLLVQRLFQRATLKRAVEHCVREMNGRGYAQYTSHDDGLRRFPKDWFGTPVPIRFEGKTVMGPAKVNDILTRLYGEDYMTPPPPEKRFQHMFHYCNFDKGYKET